MEKRNQPDWQQLYAQKDLEEMPWFHLEFDPDMAAALKKAAIKTGRVLDVGCGPGTEAAALKRLGFEVTAADVSHAAIKKAADRFSKELPAVHFVQDDILNTRLEGPFDVIVDRGCFHTFHHEQRPLYLKSILSLLAPGGYLFLMCFSDLEKREEGPYRFSPDDIRHFFSPLDVLSVDRVELKGTLPNRPQGLMCVMQNSSRRSEDLLQFWFGDLKSCDDFPEEKSHQWFNGGPDVNKTIAERFGDDLLRASNGHYAHWKYTPRGRLALVILLDQFTRNLHEDGRAFAQDEKALALAREAVDAGEDRSLRIVERWFLYMPFMHAEDRKVQEMSVALFERLAAETPPAFEIPIRQTLEYAQKHRDIVERFGRYPHRNEALGRATTAEEAEFLKQPGSSF